MTFQPVKNKSVPYRLERLETRLLLSADPIVAGLSLLAPDAENDSSYQSELPPFELKNAHAEPLQSALQLDDVSEIFAEENVKPTSVLFVDSKVDDLGTLLKGMADDVDIVFLDAETDGIAQISKYLDKHENISALHIVSHGNGDGFWLGDTFVSENTLNERGDDIAAWSDSLTADADILLYGCDLASTSSGQHLLTEIANLTDADVAASDDLTGAAALGGDWSLEFSTGNIESDIAINLTAQEAWVGTLGSITVTTLADQLDGDADTTSLAALALNPGSDGFVSLREAIKAANNASDTDIIFLGTGDHLLTRTGLTDDDGDFDIRFSLSIVGQGPADSAVVGNNFVRMFDVHDDQDITVTFSNLKVEDGRTNTFGGRDGAAILIRSTGNTATVDINNVWFLDNVTDLSGGNGSGGAIYNEGVLSISNSLFEDSGSRFEGGAIYNAAGATLSLEAVTISGSSTVNGDGGGIYNGGTATIVNSTIAFNSANGDGGGIHNTGNLTIGNSIVSNNTTGFSGPDIFGSVNTSLGNNIIGDSNSSSGFLVSDQLDVDPLLGLLADNGGDLKTHAPAGGSAAIDNANAAIASDTDQLGLLRDSTPDIGAFELGASSSPAQGTLWFSTDKAVSGGGQNGLDTWDEADVMSFDDPDLNLGEGTTSGTVANVINFGAATPALEGLHFVSRDVEIAGGAFQLLAGDVLFNSSNNSAVFTSNNVAPLQSGFSAIVNADRRDIVVFRPDTPGDYSAGQFAFLIDNLDGGDLFALTLVEATTVIGGSTVNAGDFLFVRNGASEDQDIKWFAPTTIGDGTTTGTVTRLLDGDDLNVNIAEQIHGLELIENTTSIGNVILETGQLLVSVRTADSVGENNLNVSANDIFILDVEQSTEFAGSGNGIATASKLFTGGHAGFDTNDERFNSLALETPPPPNIVPTFTTFAAPIDTTNEDTEVELTFAELAAQGNEADVDGTVDAFVVQAVSSGTLRIGADAGSASAFVVGVNDVIGTGLNAYWTPANNQNGTLNAFTVEARDDDGALSGTPVTAQVNVTDVNDDPTFTTFAAPIDTTNEDTEVELTFTELAAQGNEADVDGTVDSFVVQAVSSGTLRIGADAGSATAFAVGVNDVIGAGLSAYWTPASNQNGTLNAFTVEARDDDGALSGTPVTAQVNVTSINDAPTISGGALALGTIDEDTTSPGFNVGAILAGFTTNDADGDTLGLAIKTVTANADWEFSSDSTDGSNGTWTTFPSVTPNNALLLSSSSWVRYVPDGRNPENVSLLFAAWDGTTGSASSTGSPQQVDANPGGGQSAFSNNNGTATLTVTDINDIPTFTTFAAPIDTTNEDTEVEITFAELAAQGNEADVDGTVDAFVVQAVSSGTLRIGADAGSATAFAVGVNDVVGAGLNAYWTPANNQNGTLNAFTVEARDDDGALSGTPVTAQVNVTDVNDDPTFTTFAAPIDTTNEDTEVEMTFAELAAQGNEADVDGTVDAFVVQAVSSGTLRIGADAGSATAFAVGVNDVIGTGLNAYWTPTNNQNGTLNAFTVEARDDDGALSGSPVTAQVSVNDVNDDPTFTTFAAPIDTTNEDTEVELTFAELAAQGNEADVDGTVDAFVVQAVSSGTLRIGTDAGSATAFAVGVNDVIGAGLNAYWTPTNNQNGTLNAFTVEARDDDGALSGTPVTAQVNVTGVNDDPTFTTFAAPIDTTNEDTEVELTFAELAAQGNEADVDGTVNSFVVQSVSSGTLRIGADAGSATAFAVGVNDVIGTGLNAYWTPANNQNGTLNAFTVEARDDDGAVSGLPVAAQVTVTDVNDAPTFATFAAPVDTTNEDTEVEITFADLAAQGNEADVDGTVDSFVVQAVSSGTLRIGADALSATAFAAGTNDEIGVGLNAYWTPANNQNGTLNAFTVEAKDNDSDLSGTPVTAQVSVTDVNDAPTFTAFSSVVTTANASVEETISFAEIHGVSNAADADGSVAAYIVKSVLDGSLSIGTSAATATPWVLGVNDVIDGSNSAFWTPSALASGTVNAFGVVARDNDMAESAVPIQVQASVFSTNQAPTLDQNTLSVSEGQSKTITAGDLLANDLDDGAADLQLTISNVSNGQFERSNAPGVAVTSFSQADINSGAIKFVHDGGENPPGYSVTVSDGAITTAIEPATILFSNVNDAPSLNLNQLTIEQDGKVTLTVGGNVNATDPDNAQDSLIYQASNIVGGQFERADNPGIAVSSFSHQELRDGKIQFVHDGSATAPSYTLKVSDGEQMSPASAVQVSYTPRADEFFSSEEEAAEAFASSQFASQSSQLPLQSNASEDEGSVDSDELEDQLLHEQALALQEISEAIEESRAEQNVDTAGLGDFAFGDEAKDARDARSSGESLKSIIKNQLTLGLPTTDPILSPIDAALDMMVSVVESSNFRNGLDSLREEIAAESLMDQVQIGSSVAVSTGLSIGYVVWLIRGGVLVSSMLSALPAWRFIDPLPILAFGGSDEDEDQESLESLVGADSPEHQLDEQEGRQSPQTPEPGNS